jgi:hypothetical protein
MMTRVGLERRIEALEALNARLSATAAAASPRTIAWDPLGGGDATTWAEVMGFVNASPAPIQIYVKNDGTVPAGTYEMKGAIMYGVFDRPVVVTVSDGAVLRNLHEISDNLALRSVSSAPIIEFIPSPTAPTVFLMLFGSRIVNDGTSQIVHVPTGSTLIVAMFVAGGLTNPTPGIGTFLIDAGGFAVLLSQGANGSLSSFGDIAQGPAATTLAYAGFDGPYPTPVGFAGTITNLAADLNGGSGPTAFRPTSSLGGPLALGVNYFDTGIVPARPVWWDGAIWVDAAGAPA